MAAWRLDLPRLTTMWQSIFVEYIDVSDIASNQMKVGGIVDKSNFIAEGVRSLVPVSASEIINLISIGDKFKITLFTPKDSGEEIESDDDNYRTLSFKNSGFKYEIWNNEAEAWDKIYEIFKDDA